MIRDSQIGPVANFQPLCCLWRPRPCSPHRPFGPESGVSPFLYQGRGLPDPGRPARWHAGSLHHGGHAGGRDQGRDHRLPALPPSVNQGEIICDYLSILFVFSKIIWIICGLFVPKCSVFSSRLFEIIWDCGLFALFAIILDYCKLFVDYLFWIICGLFETWIIWDYLCLGYLWIIWIMDYLRLSVLGLFVDCLFWIIWDYF